MLHIHHKIWSILLLLVIMSASLITTRPATAQTSIDGRFGAYWQEHGGLPIFGLPISSQSFEANLDTGNRKLTQWFERNRFELHEENGRPYDVLLGRLGVDRLKQLGRSWQTLPKAAPSAPRYFAETGHAIAHGPFWSYWSSNGLEFDGRPGKSYQESLALFGLPLSEPAMETNTSGDRVLTQWFERARFEDHGAKGVLLGLLGNEVRGGSTTPEPAARLKYFWPRTIPQGFQVRNDTSSATETSFTLNLTPVSGGPFFAQIGGGKGFEAPGIPGEAVTVRGQRGMAYTTRDGFSVYWMEAGYPYMVKYGPGVSNVVALANDLEVLDLATFRMRLRSQDPSARMQYFWPGAGQHELSVLPEPHGGSFANETSFQLNLYRVHSRQPDVTITGGTAVRVPGGTREPMTVRGESGSLYTARGRAALVWTEKGQQYMVDSDLSLPKLLEFTAALQVVDLRTFRSRIQP